MLATILGILQSILAAIPILNKWFTKTPEQKKEDVDQKIEKEEEDFKNTGRPSP